MKALITAAFIVSIWGLALFAVVEPYKNESELVSGDVLRFSRQVSRTANAVYVLDIQLDGQPLIVSIAHQPWIPIGYTGPILLEKRQRLITSRSSYFIAPGEEQANAKLNQSTVDKNKE